MSEKIVESESANKSAQSLSRGMRMLCVGLLVLLGFSLGCSEFAVIGIEGDIAEAYGVTLSQAGQLISAFAVTYAVLTPILGLVTGRFRRFQLLLAYSAVFCVANLFQAIAPSFAVLIASRVLIGAVSGALLAVGVTFLPELLSPERTSMGLSVVYASFSVAMVIATSAGKLAAEFLDWRVVPWATLTLAVVTCAALIAVLPREGATDEPSTFGDQVQLLLEPQVLSCIAIFVFGVGSVYVFYGYVTPYLEDVLGLSAVDASLALMAYGGVTFVSNLLSGVIESKWGMPALLAVFPIQAVALLALWLSGSAMPAGIIAVMVVALLMYASSVSCVSMFMRTATQRHPKALTLASSLEPMAFNIGIAFGTVVGGMVVSGPGIQNAGIVGAAFSLVAMGFVVLTLRFCRRAEKSA